MNNFFNSVVLFVVTAVLALATVVQGIVALFEFLRTGHTRRVLVLFMIACLLIAALAGYGALNATAQTSPKPAQPISSMSATTTLSGPIYTVKNTDETPPNGVYFRHSLKPEPGQPTPTPIYGFGVFKPDLVQVSCWVWGDDLYGDHVWYYVYNVTRPTVAGRSNKGWLSAYYVNDRMAANHPASGILQCRSPLPIGG